MEMPGSRYTIQLFNHKWNVKPHRGRQRKMWGKVAAEILMSLRVNKCEWSEDIKNEGFF